VAADGSDTTAETPGEREELRTLVAQLRTNIAARGRSGLLGVPLAAAAPKKPPAAAPVVPPPSPPPRPATSEVMTMTPLDPPDEDRAPGAPRGAAGLQLVREELGDCKRCKLCTTRTNIVFGVGNPDANLVFVGEAPGADEDAQGEPFVGKAGQLLTKMIEAMGYARGDVYICNVLRCRPPGNRNPAASPF
jgi:DNA polymerase